MINTFWVRVSVFLHWRGAGGLRDGRILGGTIPAVVMANVMVMVMMMMIVDVRRFCCSWVLLKRFPSGRVAAS